MSKNKTMVQIKLVGQIGDVNYEKLNGKFIYEEGMANPLINCFEQNKNTQTGIESGAMLTAVNPLTGESFDFNYRSFEARNYEIEDHNGYDLIIEAKNPAPINTPLVFTYRNWGHSVFCYDNTYTFAGVIEESPTLPVITLETFNIDEVCVVSNISNQSEVMRVVDLFNKFCIESFTLSGHLLNTSHSEEFLTFLKECGYEYQSIKDIISYAGKIPCFDHVSLETFLSCSEFSSDDLVFHDWLFFYQNDVIIYSSEYKESYTPHAIKIVFEYLERCHDVKIFYKTTYN